MLREYLKVIEGKLRITARLTEGLESQIVDYLYVINNPDERMRFQDYLPNTTLESAVADDQIEIQDASESANTAGADVHVVYKLLALGGTLSHTSKNSEASRYHQIAPKELIVSSGTIDREHGVFFRLRPSRNDSLEGAREFTFLATVPKDWRGDVCRIACRARVKKDSFWSDSIETSGTREVPVGLYLAGDAEAASLAEELRRAADAYARELAKPPRKPSVFDTISSQTVGLFSSKKPKPENKELQAAKEALADVQTRLKQLSR